MELHLTTTSALLPVWTAVGVRGSVADTCTKPDAQTDRMHTRAENTDTDRQTDKLRFLWALRPDAL